MGIAVPVVQVNREIARPVLRTLNPKGDFTLKTIRTILLTLVFAAILTGLSAVAYMYTGRYDVAANKPENPIIAPLLSMTSDRSVTWHAQGIVAPSIAAAPMAEKGFLIYRGDCLMCHGAPGKYPTDLGGGMQPQPPRLWLSTKDLSPAEVFWIIKNGIKMTGMPSWQKVHNDKAIWSIVAFIKEQFPKLSPQAFARMDQQAAMKKGATE